MPTFKTSEFAGAALLALGLSIAWWESGKLPFEASLFPRLVIGVAGIGTLIWLVQLALPSGRGERGVPPSRRLWLAMALTALYGGSISLAGYFGPTILFIPAMAFLLGNRSHAVAGITALAFAAGIYAVFVVIFQRPLPLY